MGIPRNAQLWELPHRRWIEAPRIPWEYHGNTMGMVVDDMGFKVGGFITYGIIVYHQCIYFLGYHVQIIFCDMT